MTATLLEATQKHQVNITSNRIWNIVTTTPEQASVIVLQYTYTYFLYKYVCNILPSSFFYSIHAAVYISAVDIKFHSWIHSNIRAHKSERGSIEKFPISKPIYIHASQHHRVLRNSKCLYTTANIQTQLYEGIYVTRHPSRWSLRGRVLGWPCSVATRVLLERVNLWSICERVYIMQCWPLVFNGSTPVLFSVCITYMSSLLWVYNRGNMQDASGALGTHGNTCICPAIRIHYFARPGEFGLWPFLPV